MKNDPQEPGLLRERGYRIRTLQGVAPLIFLAGSFLNRSPLDHHLFALSSLRPLMDRPAAFKDTTEDVFQVGLRQKENPTSATTKRGGSFRSVSDAFLYSSGSSSFY